MSKKLVSLALALVMIVALAVPAMASTVVTGKYEEVNIAVVVPGNTTAVINPYALPVKVYNPEDASSSQLVSGQQIVSQPMLLRNQGEIDLNVSVTLSAKEKGAFKLNEATATDITTSTDKTGRVYLQIMSNKTDATGGNLATVVGPDASSSDIYDAALTIYATEAKWANAKAQQIQFTSKEVEHKNVAKLLGAQASESVTPGEIGSVSNPKYQDGSIALLRLSGVVVVSPKKPWTVGREASGDLAAIAADGFEAKIVYTFAPA